MVLAEGGSFGTGDRGGYASEFIASTGREATEIALAALYLDGAPRGLAVPRSRWMEVRSLLRARAPTLGGAERELRRAGFREESLVLQDARLLDWAERRLRAEVVMTAASPRYPVRWERLLGSAAPPALWVRGRFPEGPFLTIVGSRHVSAQVRRFAFECGAMAARLGYAVVSGGAGGCDRAAAQGAAQRPEHGPGVVEVLPCGLNRRRERFPGTALSAFAPNAEFSAARAMARNMLVHALGEATVVAHVQFKTGGTWHGSMEARRRGLGPLWVKEDGSRGAQALAALGAIPFSRPTDLAELAVSLGRLAPESSSA